LFSTYILVFMLCVVLLYLPRRGKIYNDQAYQESKVTRVLNDLTTKMQYPWLWNQEIIFVTASQKYNDFGFPRQGTLFIRFRWSHAGFIHTSGNIMSEMSFKCQPLYWGVWENGGKAQHILDLSTHYMGMRIQFTLDIHAYRRKLSILTAHGNK
jgi:hypothetical protein